MAQVIRQLDKVVRLRLESFVRVLEFHNSAAQFCFPILEGVEHSIQC